MSDTPKEMCPVVRFRIKCTTCKKTQDMTDAQVAEAKAIGVPISRCCSAPATVEKVSATANKPTRGRICEACFAVNVGRKNQCRQCGAHITGNTFLLL